MKAWYAVVGWDELTHSDATRGRSGSLPWHRTHSHLLDDEGYWDLPAGTRGVYRDILLVALRSAGKIPEDTLTLSRKIGVRVSKRQLEALSDAGLIGLCASEAHASRLHAASPRARRRELEVERERASSQVESVVQYAETSPDSQATRPDQTDSDKQAQAVEAWLGSESKPLNGATADGDGLQPIDVNAELEKWARRTA